MSRGRCERDVAGGRNVAQENRVLTNTRQRNERPKTTYTVNDGCSGEACNVLCIQLQLRFAVNNKPLCPEARERWIHAGFGHPSPPDWLHMDCYSRTQDITILLYYYIPGYTVKPVSIHRQRTGLSNDTANRGGTGHQAAAGNVNHRIIRISSCISSTSCALRLTSAALALSVPSNCTLRDNVYLIILPSHLQSPACSPSSHKSSALRRAPHPPRNASVANHLEIVALLSLRLRQLHKRLV